jgi:hypothetical protein
LGLGDAVGWSRIERLGPHCCGLFRSFDDRTPFLVIFQEAPF